jgi:acetyl esterase/lipase
MRNHHPPSLLSKIIQGIMGVLGMKRMMAQQVIYNRRLKKPAPIPGSLRRKFAVDEEVFQGRTVWTIAPKSSSSDKVVIFLHGGAYHVNITRLHWQFIGHLMKGNKVTFVVPDYPLAPESKCRETYRHLEEVYIRLIAQHPNSDLILMGDSAGGGLALGFAMQIRDSGQRPPSQIILFSPWLDVSMSNPEMAEYDTQDKLLHVNTLAQAGELYAGDLDVKDYRVSPIYGIIKNLGKITLFIGTHEVLLPDARKLKRMAESHGIEIHYHEYPGMFHDWVLVPSLKESREVLQQVRDSLEE